jgi:hypothetical protein
VGPRTSMDSSVKIKVFAPETNEARNLTGTATGLPQCPSKLVPNDMCIRRGWTTTGSCSRDLRVSLNSYLLPLTSWRPSIPHPLISYTLPRKHIIPFLLFLRLVSPLSIVIVFHSSIRYVPSVLSLLQPFTKTTVPSTL